MLKKIIVDIKIMIKIEILCKFMKNSRNTCAKLMKLPVDKTISPINRYILCKFEVNLYLSKKINIKKHSTCQICRKFDVLAHES